MDRPEGVREPHPVARMLQVLTGPWTWANLRGWLFLIGAVLFIKGCVIDQYAIPSGSMEPTLHGDPRFGRGDRVLVNKWMFGPRIPFTTVRLWEWATPQRWDIVVFRPVPGTSEHPALIKRVVGLPGEEVRIVEGRVLVNGVAVDPPEALADVLYYTNSLGGDIRALQLDFLRLAQINRVIEGLNPNHGPVRRLYEDMARVHPKVVDKVVESLSQDEVDALCADVAPASLNTIRHWIMYTHPPLEYGIRPEPEFTRIPEGHYFVMGDNSPNSVDGRVYGWVPGSNMLGRAFAVWWPWGRRQDFTGFSGTWWGMLLLYGIPTALVAYEVTHLLRDRRRRGKNPA